MNTAKAIEIIQDDNNKTDYLAQIIVKLNERFTSQEAMESRWMLFCLEIAQELDGRIIWDGEGVVFNFSINSRIEGL